MTPWPWAAADRLVVLKETRGGRAPRFGSFSNATYLAWREHASALEDIAAWSTRTVTLTGAGDPERVRVTTATASLFRVLAVHPIAGSLFDETAEREKVVVLSESLWRQRFGRDPGSSAARFSSTASRTPSWASCRTRSAIRIGCRARGCRSTCPLPPAICLRCSRCWPGAGPRRPSSRWPPKARRAAVLRLTPARPPWRSSAAMGRSASTSGPSATRCSATFAVRSSCCCSPSTLLLAIATTNVASVQLARATTRRRELAIRSALGASAGRVIAAARPREPAARRGRRRARARGRLGPASRCRGDPAG